MKVIFDSVTEICEFTDEYCPGNLGLKEHRECGCGRENLCQECWEQSGLKYEIKNNQSVQKETVLNLNDIIKVKFTEYAKDIYYHKYDDLINRGAPIIRDYPKVDINGYTDIQLWEFMRIFGPHIKFGMTDQIIEDNTIYIKEGSIKMTDLKDFYTQPFVDFVYEVVKNETIGLDSVYRDYIVNLVGVMGLNALIEHKLVEGCGIVNGRKLYVLCDRSEKEYVRTK